MSDVEKARERVGASLGYRIGQSIEALIRAVIAEERYKVPKLVGQYTLSAAGSAFKPEPSKGGDATSTPSADTTVSKTPAFSPATGESATFGGDIVSFRTAKGPVTVVRIVGHCHERHRPQVWDAQGKHVCDDIVSEGRDASLDVVTNDSTSWIEDAEIAGYRAGLLRAAEIADKETREIINEDGVSLAATIRAEAEKEGALDV